jgi:hypothetical protein
MLPSQLLGFCVMRPANHVKPGCFKLTEAPKDVGNFVARSSHNLKICTPIRRAAPLRELDRFSLFARRDFTGNPILRCSTIHGLETHTMNLRDEHSMRSFVSIPACIGQLVE